jgi:predicted phosphohydrolase
MSLYAIGDLHLSLRTDKAMDVFGSVWEGYVKKIKEGFRHIRGHDTVVLCGDLSWGRNLSESAEDLKFISELPGRKVLVKGNHDYWWQTVTKMKNFFLQNQISGMEILHNNCIMYDDDTAICGTRGWFFEEDFKEEHSEKIYRREIMRLESSLEAGRASGADRILVFLHYPPLGADYECKEILELMRRYGVEVCCFGHLHGNSHNRAVTGKVGGIEYKLVSADYIGFTPLKII